MSQDFGKDCEALMASIRRGDKIAYAQLLQATSSYLTQYLRRFLRQNDEIKDVVQEALISIHKSLPSYNTDRPYKPWCVAIARRRLNDYFRQRYSQKMDQWVDVVLLEAEGEAPSEIKLEKNDLLELYLDQLSSQQQTIIYMMHHDGYTAREVADRLGMTESAVKVNAHRAYKKVREWVLHS